ncbi:acyltransferase family protein [Leifsonia sp. NPDC058248]|uniref:acyltransferase family protein n=1 Tax=Leifsonia sp. NPDC058248 TaxID=3346402 RepID=UPI0036D8616D
MTAPASTARFSTTPVSVVGASAVRPEIQALRAVAVLSVVLFHVWPLRFPGGYVGVDVFFVISGYLITGHLLRETEREGRVPLASFWARRVRRLLPAAMLVLVVSAVMVFAIVPLALRRQFLTEILSSAVYVENWTLAGNAVDYFAASNVPSLSQHYWSLSVEEQFYLIWPLLLGAAALLAVRLRIAPRRLLGAVVAVVIAVSLVWSIIATPASPGAYFLTGTRVWEFGLGALLAIGAGRLAGYAGIRMRAALSLLGMLAIAVAVFGFGDATPFPGYAALLPTVGTAIVIWAGSPRGRLSPAVLYRLRPVQAIGDMSYSLYLWHWPLIIAAGYALAGPSSTVGKLALVGIAVGLAWLTRRYIEVPFRSSEGRAGFLARRRPRRSLLAAGVAMLTITVIVLSGFGALGMRDALAQQAIAHAGPSACVGAAALDPARTCDNTSLGEVIAPDPGSMTQDRGPGFACNAASGAPLTTCHFGSRRASALSVALVGDSHAAAIMPAILSQLPSLGWSLDTYLGSGCVWGNFEGSSRCANRESLQRILESTDYDVVIVTASRYAEGAGHRRHAASAPDPRVDGYTRAWAPVAARGTKIVVIEDNPSPTPSALVCLDAATDASRAHGCTMSRSTGFRLSDAPARAAARTPGVSSIDLSSRYCTPTECPMVVGNVVVYYDPTHLTATYDRTLGPYLAAQLRRAIAER